jgi:hypothetical protein
MLARMQKKGTLIHCWWECKIVQPLWKAVWRVLKKLKVEMPYDPAIQFLGTYPKECNQGTIKTFAQIFIVALVTIAKL